MNRMLSRAGRLRTIERLLYNHPDGMGVEQIREYCDVSRRTIYRDIDLLSEGGVPIWQEDGKFGIIRDQYLSTVRLNFDEATALFLAARLLSRYADEHNPHIVSALSKLATALPDPLSTHIAHTAAEVRKHPVDAAYVSVLQTITRAWASRRKVRMWYRSPRSGNVHQRVLAPYFIEAVAGFSAGSYVIGYDDWAQELRTFKLERLEKAEVLKESYDIPADFDPNAYLANAWTIMGGTEAPMEVVLRFSPEVAEYIKERYWHPSQELTQESDGSVILSVHISDARNMRPWIRSWGSEVEVLAPAEMREELIADTQRMAERYQTAVEEA